MELVLLKTFPSDVEAHLVRTKLESEGITCFLENEHISNLVPAYYRMIGSGVQLKVPLEEAEKAVKILAEMYPDKGGCPNCGSQNVKDLLQQHKYMVIAILLIIPMLIGNLIGRNTCADCGTVYRNI
jgi:hypothetical protein